MSAPETLAAALVAAQEEMPAVKADSTNPHFSSKFVSLGKLISSVRPVLNKHGIALTQMPAQDEAGRPVLVTRLVHTSGEVMESTMPLLMEKQSAQGLGSSLTYAKRYALAAALAIADQEDDDGNAAGEAPTLPIATEAQLETMNAALRWLLPASDSQAIHAALAAEGGGLVYGTVANAVIAVIKARKDIEAEEPEGPVS